MKKRSTLTLIMASALIATSLAGCGQPEIDDGTKIIFRCTFNDNFAAVIKKAAADFQKKYPEYRVAYDKFSGDYNMMADDVVKTSAVGGHPDMTVVYPDSVANFINLGISLNIQPLMESKEVYKAGDDEEAIVGWTDEERSHIPDGYMEEGSNYQVPGIYSMPFCRSTELMYYNRTALIGIDLSQIDDTINDGERLDDDYIQNLTWEELFDHLCPALIEYNNRLPDDKKILKPSTTYPQPYVVGYDSDDNFFITLAQQYGLGYTSIKDGAGSIDFVNKKADGSFDSVPDGWVNMIKTLSNAHQKNYLTTQAIEGAYTSKLSTTNACLFSIGSSAGAQNQFLDSNPFDVGVARIPQAEGTARNYCIGQGPSIAFLSRGATQEIKDRRARGMWLFYKELTNTKWATEWAVTTDYAPINDTVLTQDAYLRYKSLVGKDPATLEILKARVSEKIGELIEDFYGTALFVGSGKARSAVKGLIRDILTNKNKMPLLDSYKDSEGYPIENYSDLDANQKADYDEKMNKFLERVNLFFKQAFSNAI